MSDHTTPTEPVKEPVKEPVDSPGISDRPFVIELERVREKGNHFRPLASIRLTNALRASGLLLSLPAEEVKSLLFVLTFLSPNGYCAPSVLELASAMRVSQMKVRSRMRRLVEFRWQGKPLLMEIRRESGLDAFVPGPQLVEVRERQPGPEDIGSYAVPDQDTAPYGPTRREEVIAFSREHYARPRAEVEQAMARRMGWDEDGTPAGRIRRKLTDLGVTRDQAERLISQFLLPEIERQLEWLPYRRAKNPAAFLVAAIEGGYDEPPALKVRHEAGEGAEPPQEEPPQEDASANPPSLNLPFLNPPSR